MQYSDLIESMKKYVELYKEYVGIIVTKFVPEV
jgi:hypothetical protein